MSEWKIRIGNVETIYTSFLKMKEDFNKVTCFVKTKPDVKCYDDFPDEYKNPMLYLCYSVSERMYERDNEIPLNVASYGGMYSVLHKCFDVLLNNEKQSFDTFIRYLEINKANPLILKPKGKYLFDCDYEIGKAFCDFNKYIEAYNWSIGFKPKYDKLINDLKTSSVIFAIFDDKDFSKSSYREYTLNNVDDMTALIKDFKNELVYTRTLGKLNKKEIKEVGNEWFSLTNEQKSIIFDTIINEYKSKNGYISNITSSIKYAEMFVGFNAFNLPNGFELLLKESFVINFSKKLYDAYDKTIKGWSRHFSADDPNDHAYFGWSLD